MVEFIFCLWQYNGSHSTVQKDLFPIELHWYIFQKQIFHINLKVYFWVLLSCSNVSSEYLYTNNKFSSLLELYKSWYKKVIFSFECSEGHSVVSDSLQPYGLCRPWTSPGQNTGVGSLSLLQGIFPIQGLNLGLLH